MVSHKQLSRGRGSLGRRLRSIALAALVLGLIAARVTVARAAEADAVVTDTLNTALGMLHDKHMSEGERATQFRALLDRNFDMPRIAHFVLGPYWDSASDDERQTFLRLFEQWIVAGYAESVADYDGETVKVTGSRASGANTIVVSSEIIDRTGASGAKLDWIVHRDNDGCKIININVEGVSLVMAERDQILAVIKRGGGTIAGANAALREKLAADGPQASNF